MLVIKEIKTETGDKKIAIALKNDDLANYLFQADFLQINSNLISMKYLTTPEDVLKVLKKYNVNALKVGTMGPSLRSFFENHGIEVINGYQS